MAIALVVSTDDTRESLIEALQRLNLLAKAERRRGYAGVNGHRYSEIHAQLDTLVDAVLFRLELGMD